uniref:Cytochrome c oxidase assembly protein COX14 n=2 Tax=Octopus bimaculoides TaxID=37653 RepID=A0A0L8FNT2_OCTBM
MKQWTRTQVYDGLHRASVWTLLGITGYGLTLLGSYAFRYFTEIRPMQKELRRKQNEESITLEQIQGEKELQQKKSDSETLYS